MTEEIDDIDLECPDDRRPLYPWFGSKRRIAHEIWNGLGKIDNYIEPFLGSAAVLLARPEPSGIETVNDLDSMIANFWRALIAAPEEVAEHADWPVNETDLAARHAWLVNTGKAELESVLADPNGYDARIAGWWVWGQCCWIGSGWCSGNGPWIVGENGWELRNAGQGVNRKLPHLRNAGQGVNRKLPHLGNAGQGVNRKLPHLRNAGKGVNRKRPGNCPTSATPGRASTGNGHRESLISHMRALADRLRYVRVCCGDWARVLTPSVTVTHGITGIVLDPPYSDEAGRTSDLYAKDCGNVAHNVREWALANGDDPRLRIVLCGYDGEHEMPESWLVVEWSATGGYSGFAEKAKAGKVNKHRERLWFSPHCQPPEQQLLFGAGSEVPGVK